MLDKKAVYEVVIFAVGDTKAGTKMGKLQVKNLNDGSILNCVMWESVVNSVDLKMFRTGNKIKILQGTYDEKYNNCQVSAFELVEEAAMGLSEEEQDELFNKICERVSRLTDEKLKTFVADLLTKYEDELKIKPAAKLMHHNYLGGLLEHTYECMNIADRVCDMFTEKLNRDEVVAASILHDFGKILEYKIDKKTGLIEYEENFYPVWISHSQWGFTTCMNGGFPRIAKMIAAHHGRTDWGSMIDLNQKDLEPFVYVIHHIDDLSAKFGKTNRADLK
ncbi:MAG: HD domain-containing protein [Candidatus Gastranaerophilales bacterium]|nr:HD domain-containing protein [Candidatus Gastranaerophilales bacterium]